MYNQYVTGKMVGPEGVPIASNIRPVSCKPGRFSPYKNQ